MTRAPHSSFKPTRDRLSAGVPGRPVRAGRGSGAARRPGISASIPAVQSLYKSFDRALTELCKSRAIAGSEPCHSRGSALKELWLFSEGGLRAAWPSAFPGRRLSCSRRRRCLCNLLWHSELRISVGQGHANGAAPDRPGVVWATPTIPVICAILPRQPHRLPPRPAPWGGCRLRCCYGVATVLLRGTPASSSEQYRSSTVVPSPASRIRHAANIS